MSSSDRIWLGLVTIRIDPKPPKPDAVRPHLKIGFHGAAVFAGPFRTTGSHTLIAARPRFAQAK